MKEPWYDDEMEMPCICESCGVVYDLHDGVGSTKWYPKMTICEACGEPEDQEIQLDDELSEAKDAIEDAQWIIEYRTKEIEEIVQKQKDIQDKITDRQHGGR